MSSITLPLDSCDVKLGNNYKLIGYNILSGEGRYTADGSGGRDSATEYILCKFADESKEISCIIKISFNLDCETHCGGIDNVNEYKDELTFSSCEGFLYDKVQQGLLRFLSELPEEESLMRYMKFDDPKEQDKSKDEPEDEDADADDEPEEENQSLPQPASSFPINPSPKTLILEPFEHNEDKNKYIDRETGYIMLINEDTATIEKVMGKLVDNIMQELTESDKEELAKLGIKVDSML